MRLNIELDAPNLANRLVRFEPLAEVHRELLQSADLQEAVWKWMPPLVGGTRFEAYLDQMLAAQAKRVIISFTLFHQKTGEFAGITGFRDINRTHRRLRIGFAWHPPEGFTPNLFIETQISMISRAIEWGAKRIEWRLNPRNTFMMTHLEMVGPTREALLRQHDRVADGSWADRAVFAMTRAEAKAAIAAHAGQS